jgi:hypothetical protein
VRPKYNRLQSSPRFLLENKEKIGAEFLDANLTRVASECHDAGRLPVCVTTLLAKVHTLKNDKGMRGEEKNCWGFEFLI